MKRIETGYKKEASKEQIDLLLNAIDFKQRRSKIVLQVMRYTGLRVSDATALRIDEINWSEGCTLMTLVMKKTGRVIKCPINEKLKNILFEYLEWAKFDNDNPYLFQTRQYREKKTHIKDKTIRWALHKARIKSGLNKYYYQTHTIDVSKSQKLYNFTSHVMRHYFATQIYEKSGNDIRTVNNMLGHSPKRLDVTMRYIDNVKMDKKKEIAEMID